MEFDNLVKLIQAVSESELTRFSYEENGVSISMKKDKKQKLVTINNVIHAITSTAPAAPSRCPIMDLVELIFI